MFKELMQIGGDFSSSFMSSVQSIFSNSIRSDFLDSVETVTGEVKKLAKEQMNYVKVKDVNLQVNTYGKIIPEVFGRIRISGNVVWASPVITRKTNYAAIPLVSKVVSVFGLPSASISMTGSFAIVLCAGPIDDVGAIYADGMMLDLKKFNVAVYKGDEEQLPNSTIQSHIGKDNVPAFRGLAYVVFTDFPLEQYNGRMPNFDFDVVRKKSLQSTAIKPEDYITGVTMIPGSGEFVYDSDIQYGYIVKHIGGIETKVSKNHTINMNQNESKSDFLVSLDHLKRDLPKVDYISLVVSWFASGLDIKDARVYPCLEFPENRSTPDPWAVSSYTRENGILISRDADDRPIFGGTVSDSALLRGIAEIKKRGYKVCLYPMVFIDQLDKPWRGHMSGKPDEVDNFFTRIDGYNNFIMHYANLVAGKVDAFVIGSEFIGITKVRDSNGGYPGVKNFVSLARDVKTKLGTGTKITYAADWSEYHHTDNGWFNMDELWASQYIDCIGIDAYFPLTNSTVSTYDVNEIMHGWESGEGYEFYYKDKEKTEKEDFSPAYAWKNIRYFWENEHTNPDGNKTLWRPKMKKVWFTEYGFPSTDCATNSPNVFYSEGSADSGFPHLSKGRVDFKAQRNALYASEMFWLNSDMVEKKFVWTWDARPYPFFPSSLSVWSDGGSWKYGHFLNGKIGYSTVGDVVRYLCMKAGLTSDQIDVSELNVDISGYVVDAKFSAVQHISLLSDVFSFDGYVNNGVLIFKKFDDFVLHELSEEDIVIEDGAIVFEREEVLDDAEFPDVIELLFQNREDEYKFGTVRVANPNPEQEKLISYKVGMAITPEEAKNIAYNIMIAKNIRRVFYTICLPIVFADRILPLDIIALKIKGEQFLIRVNSVAIRNQFSILITGVSDDKNAYTLPSHEVTYFTQQVFFDKKGSGNVAKTDCEIVDTYNFLNEDITTPEPLVYCAVFSEYENWNGGSVFYSTDSGETYNIAGTVVEENVVGRCVFGLRNDVNYCVVDNVSKVILSIRGGNKELLSSVPEEQFFEFANIAMIDGEIVSFRDVEYLDDGTVLIKGFLRGRFGTERFVSQQKNGSTFVFCDLPRMVKIRLRPSDIDKEMIIKLQSRGEAFDDATEKRFTLSRNSIVDLNPANVQIGSSDDDIVIKWDARPRAEFIFFDDADRENSTKYNVIIHDKTGNPIRKIFVANESTAVYSKEMQMEDFGSLVSGVVPDLDIEGAF